MIHSSALGGEILIDCQSLWKIFGHNTRAALEAVTRRGATKADVLRDFNCVVGVSDVSLQLRRGEIFCIMGLSGSGKSTVLNAVAGLLRPQAGRIAVDGAVLTDTARGVFIPPHRRRLGIVRPAGRVRPDAAPVARSGAGELDRRGRDRPPHGLGRLCGSDGPRRAVRRDP